MRQRGLPAAAAGAVLRRGAGRPAGPGFSQYFQTKAAGLQYAFHAGPAAYGHGAGRLYLEASQPPPAAQRYCAVPDRPAGNLRASEPVRTAAVRRGGKTGEAGGDCGRNPKEIRRGGDCLWRYAQPGRTAASYGRGVKTVSAVTAHGFLQFPKRTFLYAGYIPPRLL